MHYSLFLTSDGRMVISVPRHQEGGRGISNLGTQSKKYSRNMVKCCKGLASHPGDSKMHIEGGRGSVCVKVTDS